MDCERLLLPNLVREVEAAGLRRDRPALFLYHRYGWTRANAAPTETVASRTLVNPETEA